MGGDRAAVLTLRSAVSGAIDYREADLHSPMWWKRWRYLVRTLDDQAHTTLLDAAFRFQLALVSNPRISSDDFSKTQKESKNIFSSVESSLRPWVVNSREDSKQKEIKAFREEWKKFAGFDLSDEAAVSEWSKSVGKDTKDAVDARENAELIETKRQAAFFLKIEEIKNKRRLQQGSKRQ